MVVRGGFDEVVGGETAVASDIGARFTRRRVHI